MIAVRCYSCGSTQSFPYAEENGCRLVKCAECGLLYVNPRPSDDEIEAGVMVGMHKGECTLDSTGHYLGAKESIYRHILPDIYRDDLDAKPRVWLDVGCGHGELLVVLPQLSHGHVKPIGIEPNQRKIAAARQRGLAVDFFDLTSSARRYDVISMLNVYSHLPNPHEFLEVVRGHLTPGGEILLETGDTAGLPPEEHPRPFILPDHLSFGSQAIIESLLKDVGFRVISVHKYPQVKLWVPRIYLTRFIKACLPTYRLTLSEFYSWFRAGKFKTDMWIRAAAN